MSHIELAKWAHIIIIALATARTISKLVTSAADDILTTTCLASTAPIFITDTLQLQLTRTKDILLSISNHTDIYKVGFCAETENILTNAREKNE